MEPIFFPFTELPEDVLAAMAACFDRFVVYRPSDSHLSAALNTAQSRGNLILRVPVKGDASRLKAVVDGYRNWSECHGPEGLAYLRNMGGSSPFFNDMSPAKIRNDIRRGAVRQPAEPSSDPVFNARVFLQIAQDLDRENAEISRDLAQVNRSERALMENLQGADAADLPGGKVPAAIPEDSGTFMTAERMAAWSRLMIEDPDPSGLFMTASPAVFDATLEAAPEAAPVCSLDAIPRPGSETAANRLWRQTLLASLDAVARGSRADEPGDTAAALPPITESLRASLAFYRVSGTAPRQFFARFDTGRRKKDILPETGPVYPHTLVGFLRLAP